MARRITHLPAGVVVAVLAPLPLLYGAVHPVARAIYVVAATVLLIGHVALRVKAGKRVAPGSAPVVIFCVGVAWAVIALVPAPAAVLEVMAPATWRIAVEDVARAGVAAKAWLPIAVDARGGMVAVATAIAHLAIFVVSAAAFGGRRGARALATLLVLEGAAISLLAVVQAFGHAERIYFVGLEREQFYGTFVNGNHTATFLGACALAGLGLMLREREVGRRAAWGVASVVCSVGVLHSLSRGGIIAFAIGLGVFLLGAIVTQASARRASRDEIGRFFQRHAVLLMLLGLSVFYLSWLGPRRIGRELATIAALDLPDDYRVRVWRDSAGIVADWPLTGSGPGSFAPVFPLYRTFDAGVRTEMAESEWVQSAAEGGIVTAALALAFAAAVLLPFAATYFADPFRFSGAHLGFAAALLGIAAHSAVDFPLRVPAIGAITAAMAGALVGALHLRMRRRAAPPSPLERLGRIPRPERRLRDEPGSASLARAIAWAAAAPLAWALMSFALAAEEESDPAERVRDEPASVQAWLALAKSMPEGARREAAWEITVSRDPASSALRRLAAREWTRAGKPDRAADELRTAIAIVARRGDPRANGLRVELAEQLLWSGDLEGARAALEASGDGGPRAALLRGDILAASDDARVDEAIDAYLRVTGELAKSAASRALLLAANRASGDEPIVTRARVDRIARAFDPGAALRALTSIPIDTKRVWGGPPFVTLDAFDAGEPRLTGKTATVEHAIANGEERLLVRYADVSTTSDVWTAPLPLRSEEPALAIRVRLRSESRVGDQACVRGAKTTWGAMRPAGDAFEITIAGAFPGAIAEWCFDTRGRPGPWRFDAIEAILLP